MKTLNHECTQPVGITTADLQAINDTNHLYSPYANNAQVSGGRKKTTSTNKTVIKCFYRQYTNLDTRVDLSPIRQLLEFTKYSPFNMTERQPTDFIQRLYLYFKRFDIHSLHAHFLKKRTLLGLPHSKSLKLETTVLAGLQVQKTVLWSH